MKRYIEPAMKQICLDSEDIMDMTISNTVGDEGQFLNEGLFDDLDDELDDNLEADEADARQRNYSNFHVWER